MSIANKIRHISSPTKYNHVHDLDLVWKKTKKSLWFAVKILLKQNSGKFVFSKFPQFDIEQTFYKILPIPYFLSNQIFLTNNIKFIFIYE